MDTPAEWQRTADWVRQVPATHRVALQRLHSLNHAWNLVILLYPAVWLVTLLVLDRNASLWVRVPCYVIIGVSINAMVVLMHEASHYALFRRRSLDRWIGFFMGAPVLVSSSAYRVSHVFHHRHTREAEDPDEMSNVTRNRTVLSIFFYIWPMIGTPLLMLHQPVSAWPHAKPKERREIVVEYMLIFVLWFLVVALAYKLGRLDLLLHGWVFPMFVVSVLTNMRGWSEHSMTDPAHPLTRTRTVTSNKIVSFLMCNLNYHIEHHLFPGVPWYNLQKVHALLRDEYDAVGASISKSYVVFFWRALRTGVHGMTHLPTL